ncbi:conserved hypothetical protein [Methanocaldococcus sp. FS406-22]|uniref:hypothetical protein n=1 Tax=Methanocaldococcus sp. (strain FS406-22) TaxID=644281 RepID=UPI0001BF2468|nr:hypothetical protein [Methanocaldococcus sp. FS406-22]ADC70138.1 conserved hypothetical protein [Methanocaldococcus sp. FS406-22]
MGGDIYIPPKPKPEYKSEYRYALWYFTYNKYTNCYEKEFNGEVSDLLNRKFNYAIALEVKEGSDIPQSGFSYDNGYNDGKELGKWVDQYLRGIDYFVAIPYYRKGGDDKGEKRGLEYWKGYVDGIHDNTSDYQIGFYWNLEYPNQVKDEYITDFELNELSEYIRNERHQEFIWIPYLNDIENPDNTDIKTLSKYFDYVFVQPHYYQAWKYNYLWNCKKDASDDERESWKSKVKKYKEYIQYGRTKLLDILNWIKEIPNGYIEMEVDGQINDFPDLINRACDYIILRKSLTGRDIWQRRAYYFDIKKEFIDKVRGTCPEW